MKHRHIWVESGENYVQSALINSQQLKSARDKLFALVAKNQHTWTTHEIAVVRHRVGQTKAILAGAVRCRIFIGAFCKLKKKNTRFQRFYQDV